MQNELKSAALPVSLQFHLRHGEVMFEQILATAEHQVDEHLELIESSNLTGRHQCVRSNSGLAHAVEHFRTVFTELAG